VFPSMRLLIRTLVASADRLRFLMIFYFLVMMIFSIMGVNLMQGVTTYRCRQTPFPVDNDWLTVPGDEKTCGWSHKCEFACGSLYNTNLLVNDTMVEFPINNVTDFDRDSRNMRLLFGYANFNNLYMGFFTLFQISTLQDWSKIMYLMSDAYNSYIASIFFVIYILISNYFMQILTIGIIMQRFIELNDHKERQQIY
jgi:Ion transport protein